MQSYLFLFTRLYEGGGGGGGDDYYQGRGICHGTAGNAYAFLSLYRASGHARHLVRAQRFASIMEEDKAKLHMHVPDNPYSLFEGDGGKWQQERQLAGRSAA